MEAGVPQCVCFALSLAKGLLLNPPPVLLTLFYFSVHRASTTMSLKQSVGASLKALLAACDLRLRWAWSLSS